MEIFQKAIREIASKLEGEKQAGRLISYALIGGLAVSWHGEPRSTADIDFAVKVENNQHQAFSLSLNANFREGDSGDPLRAVFTLESAEVSVQLIELPKRFSNIIFENIEEAIFGNIKIPIVDAASLVVIKLYAGGRFDIKDVESIIENQANLEDFENLLRERAGQSETLDIMQEFLREFNKSAES